ncbi:MAG: acetoacetate--CoA ligase [Dehalococcoidia bacterium]|nr:acetoacetate--CoA ligase [Dehalococcoidia bacterium]
MDREESAEPVSEGTVLWQPSEEQRARANITRYLRWLRDQKGLDFGSYEDLWAWSVTDLEAFWASIWDFFGVKARRPYTRVLAERRMPRAQWFAGAELNYAEHALQRRDDHPAVVFKSEDRPLSTLTYAELYRQVAAVAAGLRRLGVQRGDRVVAYMPNIPQTLVAFLAVASIGAIWSSCSPEFGIRSVVDRFRLIEPKVLFAVDGYRYNGRPYERLAAVAEIEHHLPTLEATVLVPYLDDQPAMAGLANAKLWDDLLDETAELSFEAVPFEHPLWVLYSSGTTGPPKAIVQGHGGILLEHLKALSLHLDLTAEDRFFWFTTTGWMMWNFLIGGLLLDMTVVLYDGSPGYPDMRALWQLAEETGMTYFGTSAPYILSGMKAGIEPGREFNLSSLRAIGSTGSPLPPEGFRWVYDKVKPDLLLGSVSGGTDLCTAFVLSCPILPVHAGEIQCRGLGARVEAYDEQGHPIVGEVGELVITEPLPSMPLFFWNDPDDQRYRASYFDVFPGVWRHGDWIKIAPGGSCVIYGRSDSTLNRAGVRMGSSEFYRVVEELPEILDSRVVDTGQLGSEGRLLLFVVLRSETSLDEQLQARIREKLRQEISPRYVPDEIYAIPEVPCTLNGKKLEVPVKRILSGTPPETVVTPDAIANPRSINFFIDLARSLQEAGG